ncbi:MAG: hypothetical protein A2035_02945 [Nitrospirae bacterium GWA2_42_11]|nr:MAG: hypothetical protein A2035_02945 [Nitrospirae bacterium GWA2_42_11]OGW55469.1 MAG: hypothetical protein A3D21_07615 [Nitrospirae bacterium RIFCSPHIGHO2_02_FULL_42_12]
MPRFLFIVIASVMVWISNGPAFSQGITDIIVTSNNNELMVSASYRGGFTPEIKKEIISGVSREFFYYIVLYKVMPNWMDEESMSKTIRYTVKYDILKNQFLVNKSIGDFKEEQVFDSYDDMVEWVSGIDKVNLAPVKILSKRHKYYVSVKAEIKSGELPFLLRYLLFFFPYSEFSTDWENSKTFMLKDLK